MIRKMPIILNRNQLIVTRRSEDSTPHYMYCTSLYVATTRRTTKVSRSKKIVHCESNTVGQYTGSGCPPHDNFSRISRYSHSSRCEWQGHPPGGRSVERFVVFAGSNSTFTSERYKDAAPWCWSGSLFRARACSGSSKSVQGIHPSTLLGPPQASSTRAHDAPAAVLQYRQRRAS